eukprot:TRINITY_DN24013_c0_g1_i1.p2 TRINITY_DN24013_c0_g1~~TRINITY_DN24013_c0_g1_i1.p2  ORF type:complete len:109 (-),score=21.75 TRINITY_DN24013_c0_g1_i1:876-1202(-)
MEFLKSFMATDAEEDAPIEAGGSFVRDWEDHQAAESGWSSWNPLSSGSNAGPAQPALTPDERRKWRLLFWGGCVGFVLAFYFVFPESDGNCGSFAVLTSLSASSCFAG